MTFLGFKYVGGRNSNPQYLEVKAAAANLIAAKKMANGNAKQKAVAAALKRMNAAVNTYVKGAAVVVPPAGGAGGPPPPGGPPPGNKNANINMRPLTGRGVTGMMRRPIPQPNSDTVPVKVPGQASIQLLSNNTAAVVADVYKYKGSFYGMMKQHNKNRRANIFYKVRAVRDNPPTFKFILDAQEYKLNKNTSTNAVTGISPKTNSPFSGGNGKALANFEQWWGTTSAMNNKTRADQFLEFLNAPRKPMTPQKTNENTAAFEKRKADNKTTMNRYIRITSITPKTDPKARTRQQFWKLVANGIQKIPPNNLKTFGKTWWDFFNKLPNGGIGNFFGPEIKEENRQLRYNKFTSWYAGLPQTMNAPARARLFANIARLPNKAGRNNATYSRAPNVTPVFPLTSENANNAARTARIARLYQNRNMALYMTKNINNASNKNGKANSAARANFWRAVAGFMPAAARAGA